MHFPAVQLRHPDWQIAWDVDPLAAARTRGRILDRAVADRVLVAGSHIPFPSLGHVCKARQGYEWEPVIWDW